VQYFSLTTNFFFFPVRGPGWLSELCSWVT